MNQFLQTCKTNLKNLSNYQKIFVVIGNESCDLDSVVSALTYAYFLHKQYNISDIIYPVLPVLNIHEEEFPLKTESKYFLAKLNINSKNLIFRNEINLMQLYMDTKLKLILVDHHVLLENDKIFEKCVIEIIDHRPIDKNTNWKNVQITIDNVGSCATLIVNKIFHSSVVCINENIAKLLHGTIILDTVNFNVKANRFSNLDIEIVTRLESDFKIPYTREEIFHELTKARSDISTLTPFQILQRDLKIINSVPIIGCPLLIQDFLKLTGAKDAMTDFCKTKNCKVIIIMGMLTKHNKIYRDIGIYSIQECDLKNELIQKLTETKELKLSELNLGVDGLVSYSQKNVKMSRKLIVPILSPVIADSKCGNILSC